MLHIKLFYTPFCPHCARIEAQLNQLAGEFSLDIESINVIDALDQAVELGIIRPPALVINGELVLSGSPSKTTLHKLLAKKLTAREIGAHGSETI